MPHLPTQTVRTIVAQDQEIPAAFAWAKRAGLRLHYDEDVLALSLEGRSADGDDLTEAYLLTGQLDDYDVLPPIWRFVDPRNREIIGPPAYPQPISGSVLHPNGLICAPWSRLAYSSEGGPHNDWGVPTGWKTAAPGSSHAVTIPDMLQRLVREVRQSRGRMAPLPPLA